MNNKKLLSFRKYRPVLPALIVMSVLTASSLAGSAQQIDSIYFHPYTDSLKKGTYNYINVDGLLAKGRYLPLDSTHIEFSSTIGFFRGNSLWIPANTVEEKAVITAVLKKNPSLRKDITLYIKKLEESEPLKTLEEILGNDPNRSRKKPGKKASKKPLITTG